MKEITPLLEKLAAQLGTTTEYLWKALLKQASISGVCYLIMWVVMIILTIGFFSFVKWSKKMVEKEDWDDVFYIVPGMVGIALLICWLCLFVDLSTLLAAFFNPEYWALGKVMQFIGN